MYIYRLYRKEIKKNKQHINIEKRGGLSYQNKIEKSEKKMKESYIHKNLKQTNIKSIGGNYVSDRN